MNIPNLFSDVLHVYVGSLGLRRASASQSTRRNGTFNIVEADYMLIQDSQNTFEFLYDRPAEDL